MIRSIFIGALLCAALTSYAQWNPNGATSGSIYYNGGSVGIGTESPSNIQGWNTVLDVSAPIATKILATASSQNYRVGVFAHRDWYGGGGFIGTESNHNLYFLANYNVRMTIKPDGFVGIGTLNPGGQLHLASDSHHEFKMTRASGLYGMRIFRNAQEGRFFIQNTDDSNVFGTRIQFDEGGPGWKNLIFNPDGGNVGIGTTSPNYLLQVHSANVPTIAIGRLNANTNSVSRLQFFAGNGSVANGFSIDYCKNASADRLVFTDGGSVERMTILNGGNVGIGTTTPDSKLTVDGRINCEEVKVEIIAGTGPDYVFEPGYNLPTLTEIETYIKANKHLPEVPSAKEMETNGINLSETNMLLLKKVEELTLHLIRIEKKSELQQQELNELKKIRKNRK